MSSKVMRKQGLRTSGDWKTCPFSKIALAFSMEKESKMISPRLPRFIGAILSSLAVLFHETVRPRKEGRRLNATFRGN